MAQRRMEMIALVLCLCLCVLPCYASAASTSDAASPIETGKSCSLTLTYASGDVAFDGLSVALYKVADVSSDLVYTLCADLEGSALTINGISTADEWSIVRSTLEALITADSLEADYTAVTSENGQASFKKLTPGLYLAIVGTATKGNVMCHFDSTLIALPSLGVDGLWQYKTEVIAKPVIDTQPDAEEDIQLKVLKLWRDEGYKTMRPDSIEVEIFRDGVSHESIVLSDENNWSYSWITKNDGSEWTVVERNVPAGYVMTVENRENTFVLTNTYTPQEPEEPFNPPQTGDTSSIMLYFIIMNASGIALIILGFIGKRKRA